VNQPHEPILLLAHADRPVRKRRRGCNRVRPASALHTNGDKANNAPNHLGRLTSSTSYLVKKATGRRLERNGAHVEGCTITGARIRVFVFENNGCYRGVRPEMTARWGSLQCPTTFTKALGRFRPSRNKSAGAMETGGAFGGKEEYTLHNRGALPRCCDEIRQAVKIVYDRMEDMAID